MNAPLSDPNYTQLLANIAFHELMHNKLDALPKGAGGVLDDIHTQGGHGLALPVGRADTPLTADNIKWMAPNLARPVPQYTRASDVSRMIVGGNLTLINGSPAPIP